jgi:hypothetical protein
VTARPGPEWAKWRAALLGARVVPRVAPRVAVPAAVRCCIEAARHEIAMSPPLVTGGWATQRPTSWPGRRGQLVRELKRVPGRPGTWAGIVAGGALCFFFAYELAPYG